MSFESHGVDLIRPFLELSSDERALLARLANTGLIGILPHASDTQRQQLEMARRLMHPSLWADLVWHAGSPAGNAGCAAMPTASAVR